MPQSSRQLTYVLLFAAIGFGTAGCASKDDVSPAEVETQAFEDHRSEIRELIDDPAREGKAPSEHTLKVVNEARATLAFDDTRDEWHAAFADASYE